MSSTNLTSWCYFTFELLLGTRVSGVSKPSLCSSMSCCYSAFELLLGTWPSACYQRVDDLLQLFDIYSAFELLLGAWPSACYQRVDVLSQLLDSPLHVGFRNYQSSPTRRVRTENKKMSNKWKAINSLVHKIRLHGRRGKGTAESLSREK